MPSWLVWTAIALAVLGTVLNARKNWRGFVLWIVADAGLCVHNVLLGEWAQAALWLVYLGIASYGLVYWRRASRPAGHLEVYLSGKTWIMPAHRLSDYGRANKKEKT